LEIDKSAMDIQNSSKSQKKKKVSFNFSEAEMATIQQEANNLGCNDIADYFFTLHSLHVSNNNSQSHPIDNYNKHSLNPHPAYKTKSGTIYCGDSSILMQSILGRESVDLIMTSPPFGLVRQKEYGNEDADMYLAWFKKFADGFVKVLKPNGSLVIDIGGAWKKGQPTRSLYHFELLIMLCREYGLHLAQEFYWWNPAKLPTPAEWVNVRRVRVKDAVNCIWWLSRTPFPKASNRRVLQPYSKSMNHLLKNGYKPKLRPSGHDISDKFQRDNGGAIPPNLIALANTESNGSYQRYCRERGLSEHPARFPAGIPAFFVRMLTNPGDVVLDPFAGSCVTGEVSERMNRKWICCELDEEYVKGAIGRFEGIDKVSSENVGMKRIDPYVIYPPNTNSIDNLDTYLFSWDNIPGNENGRLIEFISQKFGIDWVKTAKIEKIDDGNTIRVTNEENYLSLRLNDERTKINFESYGGRTAEFIARTENGNLNIYLDTTMILDGGQRRPEIFKKPKKGD